MFTGQWEISILSFQVSIPMILVWVILFLIGLSFILTQINVTYLLPNGEQVVTNLFGSLFHWLFSSLRGL